MPVECRHKHNDRHRVDANFFDDLEGGRAAKLDVEQHDVRSPLDNGGDGRLAPAALAHTHDVGQLAELPPEPTPRHRLVVDDQHFHCSGTRMSTRAPN
jgi:hypothetical protein